MTIPVSSVFLPKTPAQWLAQMLADGITQGLTSTSWQSGDPILTTWAVVSEELAKEDGLAISLRAQGAFLDYAATGSVTLVDDLVTPATSLVVYVTPDPSIPAQNPTGAPGLLDALASSVYNVKRLSASAATGTLYLTNTSGVSLESFVAGTFHVQNFLTGATYSNQTPFTFTTSAVIGTTVTAATAAIPVSVTTSTAHGLSTGAVIYAKGLLVVLDNFYTITSTGANTFTLNGTSGAGSYTGTAGRIYAAAPITFAADLLGPVGNAGILNINQLVTAAPLSFCGNLSTFAGAPWQSNVSLAALCRAKLAALSPNGPPGAYLFFAIAATLILGGLPLNSPNTPSAGLTVSASPLILTSPIPLPMSLDGGPITRALVSINTATGAVTTTVANAGGVVAGRLNVAISGATTASPIVVTATAHGLVTGDWAQVNGVLGLTGVNGRWQVTRIDANNVSLNGSTGAGAYTASTGLLSGGDVYAVNAVLQAYATPNAVTSTVVSAGPVAAVVAATVYVPASFVGDYATKMTSVMGAYFTSFPIGGLNVDAQANVLPIGAIEGILYSSGQSGGTTYTLSTFGVTINGVPNDLSLGPTGVAVLGVLTGINVIGV